MSKIGVLVLILVVSFLCQDDRCFAYSDPTTWSTKKETVIRLAVDFIANREAFSEKCYKDGHGYSAGYGDFHWCDDSIKVLRWKNYVLKFQSDSQVRKKVKITKEQARWRLKKFVINVKLSKEKASLELFVKNQNTSNVKDNF